MNCDLESHSLLQTVKVTRRFKNLTSCKMTTTNLYSGIGEKNSSRVLKPPGGGHSNIFGEPDACPIRARPKYNQQNSSNLAYVCGTMDANEKVAEPVQKAAPVQQQQEAAPAAEQPAAAAPTPASAAPAPSAPAPQGSGDRARVPPGGFSSGGFW